jgi:carbon monoxide dehydrogenase subunit G
MPEVRYSTTVRLPVETLWDFVQEMDNWASFVRGYQGHEKQSASESTWTLKGDVGVLARTVRFRVRVTEWNGPERVRFELEGLNEPMKGSGTFSMQRFEAEAPTPAPAARRGLLARLLERVFRWLYRLRFGAVARSPAAGPGPGMARMTFALELEPGGPMAPMVNALLRPLLLPAAEELANRIVAHLEAGPSSGPPGAAAPV